MFVQRRQHGVAIQAPAKLNLFLEVLARRVDGFHEVETLICPIGVYDILLAAPRSDERLDLAVAANNPALRGRLGGDGASLNGLPAGPENLVLRAAALLRSAAGIRQGADFQLLKRIPTAAGLGGGSSDAAAALAAGNLIWNLNWPRPRLAELAAELGSDVPFFLAGPMAVCRGRGERVTPVDGGGDLHFVVVRPPGGLSTAEVYGRCTPAASPRSAAPLLAALGRGDRRKLAGCLHNQLQPAAAELSPPIGRLRDEFERLDCVAHQMSGSGSSYFGLFPSALAARRAAARVRARGVGQVFATRSALARPAS
jgi:4-diphosphocytidyl-2-C-methyl-D-erythritol kinase